MPKKSDDTKPEAAEAPAAPPASAEAPADAPPVDDTPEGLRARLVDSLDRYDRLSAEHDRLAARFREGPIALADRAVAALEVQALALLVPQLRLAGRAASAEKALARASALADLDA